MKRTTESTRDEIRNQAEAIRRIMQGASISDLEIIAKYACEWRKIINEFERDIGRVPTADDIIWITGVHHRSDPTKTTPAL